MKCYLNFKTEKEEQSYLEYLEDIFDVSFKYSHSINGFNCFCSKENKMKSYLLVRGENWDVLKLLKNISIVEKNLILITCTVEKIICLLRDKKIVGNNTLPDNKKIIFPTQMKFSLTGIEDGIEYGLEFNACKSEIQLKRNNNKYDIYKCLELFFNNKKAKECV